MRGGRTIHENKDLQIFSNWPKSLDSRTEVKFPLIFLAFLRFNPVVTCSRAHFSSERKSALSDQDFSCFERIPAGKIEKTEGGFL